jgi:hypothetical protein
MPERIKVYALDEGGVQLVKSRHHMADNEYEQGQNADFGDVRSGGGIETRGGMEKVNTVAMDGAVLGFVDVPLLDLRNFGLDRAIVELSSSQLDTLDATTVPIVPAPGPGLMIVPYSMKLRFIRSGSSVWSAAPTLQCVWEAQTTNLVASSSIDGYTQVAATIDKYYSFWRDLTETFTTSFQAKNRALHLRHSVNTNPGSDASMTVEVLYQVVRYIYP